MIGMALALAAAPLPALTGTWQGTGDYARVTVDYRAISNDLATVERWRTVSGRETMTTFVADRGAIVATHYCGQGNVATLRGTPAADGAITFDFVSAQGVDPGEGVLVRLVLERKGDRLRRVETYRGSSGDSVEVIDFRAVAGTPPPSAQAR